MTKEELRNKIDKNYGSIGAFVKAFHEFCGLPKPKRGYNNDLHARTIQRHLNGTQMHGLSEVFYLTWFKMIESSEGQSKAS